MPENGPQTIFGGRILYQPAKTSGTLTRDGIEMAIKSLINQKKIVGDPNAIYNVMFHGNYAACWWNCNPCPPGCKVSPASAFHYVFDMDNKALKYAVVGDPTTSTPVNQGACPFSIVTGPFLNNDPASSCMATTYIHEILEAITDPTGPPHFTICVGELFVIAYNILSR